MRQEKGALIRRACPRDRLDRSGWQLGQCCSLQLRLNTRYVGLQGGSGLSVCAGRTGPKPLKRACTNLVEVAHDSRQSLVVKVWLRSGNAGAWRVDPDLIQSVILRRGRPAMLVNTVHGDDVVSYFRGGSEEAGMRENGTGSGREDGKKRETRDGCNRGERQLAHGRRFEWGQG